jgi:hypothetical protein
MSDLDQDRKRLTIRQRDGVTVYWNEKLTTWPLTLVNGIPTRREAEQIQFQLLEVMTKSKPKARA